MPMYNRIHYRVGFIQTEPAQPDTHKGFGKSHRACQWEGEEQKSMKGPPCIELQRRASNLLYHHSSKPCIFSPSSELYPCWSPALCWYLR